VKKCLGKLKKYLEMSKRYKHTQEELENNLSDVSSAEYAKNTTENAEETRETEDSVEQLESAEQLNSVEQLENEVSELNDKYLRLYSDFDNYKKRTAKERFDLLNMATEGVITGLLDVVDDFERAIPNILNVEDKSGIELVYNKMMGILKSFGLESIESIGKPFDADFAEAIAQVPTEDESLKGLVIDEVTKGYKLKDKVIRHSKVVVNN
jgi:molecular chaperone GrpE